jgi:rSAM/selenodomain-associated transferase 2
MQERGLSVVIPTLNEEERISSLLEHLFSQDTNGKLEVIVVDAAKSTDEIKERVESCKARYVKSSSSSRAIQMHEGALLASQPLIAFLHADVIPPEGFEDAIFETLMTGIDFGYFSYRFDKETPLLRINGWFTQFKGLFTGGGDQILFMRKRTYEESGGFDCACDFMEDFEYHWRLINEGYRFLIISKPATVSARKYERNSYLRVNLVNLYVLISFKLGKDPQKLKASYSNLLKAN